MSKGHDILARRSNITIHRGKKKVKLFRLGQEQRHRNDGVLLLTIGIHVFHNEGCMSGELMQVGCLYNYARRMWAELVEERAKMGQEFSDSGNRVVDVKGPIINLHFNQKSMNLITFDLAIYVACAPCMTLYVCEYRREY